MRWIIIIAVVLGVLLFIWPGWETLFIRPMVNIMAIFYWMTNNFGLAILILTVIMRALLFPLSIIQNRQTVKMRTLQPQMRVLQKKYADKKDPESRRKYQQEIAAIYRGAGINPFGCLGPLIIQLPIWIAFYQTIIRIIPTNPDGLLALGNSLYSWNPALSVIPVNPFLFGVDLGNLVSAAPTPWQYAIPVVVGATLWLQQRVASPPNIDPQQQSTQRILQWMLPIMFGVFTWFFPAGLAFYILVSNVVGVLLQFLITPKSPIKLILGERGEPQTAPAAAKTDYTYKADTKGLKDAEETTREEKKPSGSPIRSRRSKTGKGSRKK